MKSTQPLHSLGHSFRLDDIPRARLNPGSLNGYRVELSVSGLTSNPTILNRAIKSRTDDKVNSLRGRFRLWASDPAPQPWPLKTSSSQTHSKASPPCVTTKSTLHETPL